MKPKPVCLGPEYAAQFRDRSVAQAYGARPAYATEVYPLLGSLRSGSGPVLELGAGTGDLTIGLAREVGRVDAVEPSAEMLEVARSRATDSRIVWLHSTAEDFRPGSRYSLAVAAESLHWMDWGVVLQMVWGTLVEGAYLAIVVRARAWPTGVQEELDALVPRYSTNQDYQAYDLVHELAQRRLFSEVDRSRFEDSVVLGYDDVIDWHHSQNGLSRDRMSVHAARRIDREVRTILERHCPDRTVPVKVTTLAIWGSQGA